ncbi:hypothetical protein DSO57_1004301 [Entomophthora muscae]|uniref:Uncharacterized protein n=1 Tax=Entomophthora muscae TaxID=34485 RepID=A0ACC2TW18_9FUNG|nr:hypothetical protein DSO57_1004301 [Entomophthora muscae]
MAEWKLDLETYGMQVEEEDSKHGPFFIFVNDVVTSPKFQTGMTVLVFIYVLAASIGMILEFEHFLRNDPLWKVLASAVNIFNLIVMSFFVTETLARAAVHDGGWKYHFSSNLNILDLVLVLASGVLELVDLILRLEISEAIPLIATLRLHAALGKIDKEITSNEALEASILELEYDLDLKDSDNVRLEKELAARRRKTRRTEDDIQNLIAKTSKAQATSWNHLVPAPMAIGMSSTQRRDSKIVQRHLSYSNF